MNTMYRQGDVLVRRVSDDAVPADAKPMAPENGLVILAHGESTGHHHSLPADNGRVTMYGQDSDGPRHIRLTHPATLSHQEHAAHDLEPGTYEVTIQREYTPAGIVRVLD